MSKVLRLDIARGFFTQRVESESTCTSLVTKIVYGHCHPDEQGKELYLTDAGRV